MKEVGRASLRVTLSQRFRLHNVRPPLTIEQWLNKYTSAAELDNEIQQRSCPALHSAIWSLCPEVLDDARWACFDVLRRQMSERAAFDAHQCKAPAQRQLKRKHLKVTVVIQVEFLQGLKRTWKDKQEKKKEMGQILKSC